MDNNEELNKYGITALETFYMERAAEKLALLAKDRGWDDNLPEAGTREALWFDGTQYALFASEISEALEGLRKGKQDEHCPAFTNEEVELADAIIRIFHYAARKKLRMFDALRAKNKYNITREDHSREARAKEGGKAF
jgi:hypothetical protein